jgi:hypothetical protein
MSTCDYLCEKCRIKLIDIPIDENDKAKKPLCPKCGNSTVIKNAPPNINMYTSDLPHSAGGEGFSGYNPAFGKVVNSKREAMSALKEFNQQEKEKAQASGLPFNEYHWLGDDKSAKDREYEEMRKELGAEAVNNDLRQKHSEALDKDLDTRLETKWEEFAEGLGI